MKWKGRSRSICTFNLVLVIAVSSVLLVSGSLALAADEAYPNKAVQLIIGGKAGDAYDINGRKFAPTLAKKLGVDVLVSNYLGPMSTSFFDAVRDAKPDGYSLGFGGAAHRMYHIVKPGRLNFDVNTLPVIAGMNTFPDVVWASTKSKLNFKTANDLLNYKGPIKVALFSPILVGVASLAIVANERGLDLRTIVFESMPDSHVAMLRGDCDVGTTTVSGMPLKYIEQGHYTPLFIWGKERYPVLPNVPCSRELGLPRELEGTIQQRVFLAPQGTRPDRIAKLAQGIQALLKDPEIVEWGNKASQPLFYLSPEEFDASQGELLRFYLKHLETIKKFTR